MVLGRRGGVPALLAEDAQVAVADLVAELLDLLAVELAADVPVHAAAFWRAEDGRQLRDDVGVDPGHVAGWFERVGDRARCQGNLG